MPVAGDHLGRNLLALQPERAQRELLDAGVGVGVGAHGARQLADPTPANAVASRARPRRSSVAQPSSFRPKVVGSACTP